MGEEVCEDVFVIHDKEEGWPALRVLCGRERIQEGKKDSTRETLGKRIEKGLRFNFSFLS